MNFLIKSNIQNCPETFKNFKGLFSKKDFYDKIDFQNVEFVEGNLSALLMIAVLQLTDIRDILINLHPNVKCLFSRNNFGKYIMGYCEEDTEKTSLDTWIYQNGEDEEKLNTYVYSYFEHERINSLINETLKDQIVNAIFEIIANIFQHSGQSYILMAGEFFPKEKKFHISIGNVGNNIIENVLNKHPNFSSKEAMEWALEYPNTTKKSDTLGGIGIAVLERFLESNHGKLSVVSGNIYYENDNCNKKIKDIGYDFPGTIVTLEINLNKELTLHKDFHSIIQEEYKYGKKNKSTRRN